MSRMMLGALGKACVFVLYARYRYKWGEREMGLMLAGVGVFSMIVQGGLVGPVVRKLDERQTVALGLFTGALGFVICVLRVWASQNRRVTTVRQVMSSNVQGDEG